MRWFYAWNRMKVYMINLLWSLFNLWVCFGCWWYTFQITSFRASFLLLYTFGNLSVFWLKTNMVGVDIWDTQSSQKFTQELFKQILSKNFGFHTNLCKMYGNAHDWWCTVVSKPFSNVHRACFLLSFCIMFVCQNCLLCCAEYQKQTYIQENKKYSGTPFGILRSSKTNSTELQWFKLQLDKPSKQMP